MKVVNLSSLKKIASFLKKIGSLVLWENCSKAWIIFYELIISFSRSRNKKNTKLAQGEDCYENNLHQRTAVIRNKEMAEKLWTIDNLSAAKISTLFFSTRI